MEKWNDDDEEEEEEKEDKEREEQCIKEKEREEGEEDDMNEERGVGNEEFEDERIKDITNILNNIKHGDNLELDCDEDKEEMEGEMLRRSST